MLSESGRRLMLDLSLLGALEASLHLFWHRQWCSVFPSAASLSALVFCWSTLDRLTLLSPITLLDGPLAKFNWLQATFFFFFQVAHFCNSSTPWNVSAYLLAWQTWGLEAKPRKPLLFPARGAKRGFMLNGSFKWESPSGSLCVPSCGGHILCSLTNIVKTPFINVQ